MPALLVLALVVVPIVELYVIVQVGQSIGVLPTLALLVVMSVLGSVLLRREGSRTWRALREALNAGRLPAREVADGALVILGGALLLTPGFATDVFGLLCILPPTRAVLRRVLTGVVATRLGVPGSGSGRSGPGGLAGSGAADRFGRPRRGASRPSGHHDVVEGEVVDEGPDTARDLDDDGPRPTP